MCAASIILIAFVIGAVLGTVESIKEAWKEDENK